MTKKNLFIIELDDAETLDGVFNICRRYYKIEESKMNFITKAIVKNGILKSIELLNIKERV